MEFKWQIDYSIRKCNIVSYFLPDFLIIVTVPYQKTSIGPSQQNLTKYKSETETRPDVIQPSQSGEGNTPSNSEDQAQSAEDSKQQKESAVQQVRPSETDFHVDLCMLSITSIKILRNY